MARAETIIKSKPYTQVHCAIIAATLQYSHYYKEWEEKQKMRQHDNDADDNESVPEGAMAHWLAPGATWPQAQSWFQSSQHGGSGNASMPYLGNLDIGTFFASTTHQKFH